MAKASTKWPLRALLRLSCSLLPHVNLKPARRGQLDVVELGISVNEQRGVVVFTDMVTTINSKWSTKCTDVSNVIKKALGKITLFLSR
jgi:hypothetical protein